MKTNSFHSFIHLYNIHDRLIYKNSFLSYVSSNDRQSQKMNFSQKKNSHGGIVHIFFRIRIKFRFHKVFPFKTTKKNSHSSVSF